MSDVSPNQGTNEDRIARLERHVFWLRVYLAAIAVAFVLFVPRVLASAASIVLLIAIVLGPFIVIRSLMLLLDWLFPGKTNGPERTQGDDRGAASIPD